MMEAYDSPLDRDLQQACHSGDLPAVKRLMSQGANVFACNKKVRLYSGAPLLVTHLSDKVTSAPASVAPNVVFAVTIAVPMQGFTFLMISASQAHLSVAKELLTATAGADVDAVNKQVGFVGQLTNCQPQQAATASRANN